MIGRLIEDARELVRCRPVAIRIAGRQGDDLLLGGGSDSGLKVGDLLRVGGPTVDASESLDWPMAQVVSLDVSRSEEHTSELQSLMRISYAVFCLKKKTTNKQV